MQAVMEKDREKWNARYMENPGGAEPSPVLKRFWSLASVGNVLDIACGNGRNSIFLADRGFAVDAVDISTVATAHLAGTRPDINVICADLDSWSIPRNRYTLIVNVRFLDRRLFSMIQQGLKPGGVLIFESFVDEENDNYCLQQNELLRAFQALRIVYYEEKKTDRSARFDQTAVLVAIRTAASAL